MTGHNYYALAIEGTRKQFDTILGQFPCERDLPEKHPWIQMGRHRIIDGVLLVEIEGWGSEMEWVMEMRSLAERLGCKVFWLDIPDERLDGEPRRITNDTELKYFEKNGPNEYGVTFWGFKKEYRYDN